MAYIGKSPTIGNFQKCDAISVVNGQAAYTMQVGGTNVSPESENHMLVSLNGILQAPVDSFTISGSTITFASNLATGDVIDFIMLLGNVLDLGVPSDNTVTAAKLNNDIISGQTALTSSPADTDELLISDAGTIKRVDVSLVGGKNTPAFHVNLSADQAISDATDTKIQFDREVLDTDNAFDNSTNYRFTVPTGQAGKYFIYMNVLGSSDAVSATDQVKAMIFVNGSKRGDFFGADFRANDGNKATCNATLILDLSESDYVECYAHVNVDTGAAAKVNSGGTARPDETSFGGFKMIGL